MSDPTLPGPYEPNQSPPQLPGPQQPAPWPGQPAGTTPPPHVAPAPVPPARKKPKTLAILGIVAGAVVLLCCGVSTIGLIASAGDTADDKPAALASPAPASTRPADAAPAAEEPATDATTPDEAPPTPDTFDMKPGSTLIVETSSGILEVTVKSFKTSKRACDQFGTEPDEGLYLIANVSVKITKGTGSINPLYFNWVADDGTTANSISGAFAGCGKALDSGNDMRTGTLRSGAVVFDVANTKGALEYEGGLLGGAAGSWRP